MEKDTAIEEPLSVNTDEQRELLQSDDLKELFTAFSKAQGEMRVAGNRAENPFFKNRYADLAEIVNVIRTPFKNHGISFVQRQLPDKDGANYLYTMLCHSSGQYLTSKTRVLPVKNDPQSRGSALTYEKRYALAALCGIVSADEDDDGERAMVDVREAGTKGTALNTKYNPRDEANVTITREQLDELEYELSEYPDIAEQILEGFKIIVLADMPKSKFLPAINRVRSIKAARNGKKA